ncbi:imidazole glycerol phosphate synthase subunit HisF [Yersinia enterocolitica]|uniref:AglZ/HisF2 family acetamidino modification protein n=1 Tax=Yersinia enterocolitica TaxID=630 RepID=UPI00155B0408|nr:AglZ/HisF2 family acetamidino modification protein [Yersinia enterocolitica]MBX9482625.1 imidazole glycerol phosphate synthase subunit HisF [Yersinia enterocolitica]NQS94633.1 imidazole glycerol phosphate synthase subunit HisF [Yersinia enterocolitica]NQT44843.1 imidazole glycerol phosphate synthase subunit HisF [Yersinia enterocolitica]NQT99332.1 imidazole glycerol phosphate synthase subunit HisF [Yersinia enterocolitica]HDL6874736.1 imidazole glycerol phosphate synthase subunit HisF [Yers
MLRTRIIPCLLVKNKGLVKTEKFCNPKYVGDPINAVKIFNEKEADELILLDIDASVDGRDPDYSMIKKVALECKMPFCYGGGIKNAMQALTIISLGVEKIALSSSAVLNPSLVTEISKEVGRQSVVVILDIKKKLFGQKYEVWINNGKINTKKCPLSLAEELTEFGAGEIVINSIDRDGTMKGYDIELAKLMRSRIKVPMTVLGGAGSYDDISSLITEVGVIGSAVGSLFVFKGIYKAVLINYPSYEDKERIINPS